MLDWLFRRSTTDTRADTPDPAAAPAAAPRGRQKAGKYQLLYDYLHNRYADTVVLTFGQIEDLLGFTLPASARSDQDWWTEASLNTGDGRSSDAWTLAGRTAQANLRAQTVAFERVA